MTNQSKPRKGYNGYLLTAKAHNTLVAKVPPLFDTIYGHHVTHEFGVFESLPPDADTVRVVAVASNDRVQAAVVKVAGTTARKYGNSVYHVTISAADGVAPVESNDLVKDSTNWVAVTPFDLDVTPRFFRY